MNQSQFDEPEVEAAARAAQVAAMSVTVLEALARLRAQRQAERADADERIAAAARAQRMADHAAARVAWAPAHDEGWLRRANTQDFGLALAAAAIWAHTDPGAAEAQRRVEARLTTLHPDAMRAYHQARSAGANPAEAMAQAAPLFVTRPALGASHGQAATAGGAPAQRRDPRVIAADAYPYPVSHALKDSRRRDRHLAASDPDRRPVATAHR